MSIPANRRALAAALVLTILAAGCSTGRSERPRIRSEAIAVTNSVGVPASSTPSSSAGTAAGTVPATSAPTTIVTRTASAQAEEFKVLAPTLPGLSDGVLALVDVLDGPRIDELASSACGEVGSGMSDAELGLRGMAAYNGLRREERSAAGLEDWVFLYGTLIGFFCPENLPDIDLAALPRRDGTPVEQFRAIVSQVTGVSAETAGFVDDTSDARLDELQALACETTDRTMTTDEFGLAIVESYAADLTAVEGDHITLSGYSELYGAMVGWFCAANLPL